MKAYNLQTALQNPDETTELFIHNRNLTAIPEAVFSLKKLKVLGLSHNNISALPDRVGDLQFLEKLDLSANDFKIFPIEILQLKGLKSLSLSNNNLTAMPEAIGDLENLLELNLDKNDIEKIPSALFTAFLKQLDLSENQITKLPKAMQAAGNLEKLFLQKNKINLLPESITQCRNLSVLNLNNNQLKALPETIGCLERLEKIKVSGNKLSFIPSGIGKCIFLREIDWSQNKITSLPITIGQLKWLVRFNLRKNKLKKLPASFEELSKLRRLNLEYNQLKKLPDLWMRLTSLTHLLLKGNAIEISIEAVLKLRNLKKLTGLNSLFSSAERRQFLSFLKHCRQQQNTTSERNDLYQLLVSDALISKSMLMKSLSFPIKTIRQKAMKQLLENHNSSLPLTTAGVLVFCGRSNLSKTKTSQQLQSLGIRYQRQINKAVTHVVLGEFAEEEKLSTLDSTVSFLSEQELQAIIIKKSGKNADQFSTKEIENLRRLLLSKQEQSIGLAIQILKNAVVPQLLITELFNVYKSNISSQNKRQIKALLHLNASRKLQEHLSFSLRLSKELEGTVLLKNVTRYAEGTELEVEKIIEFFR